MISLSFSFDQKLIEKSEPVVIFAFIGAKFNSYRLYIEKNFLMFENFIFNKSQVITISDNILFSFKGDFNNLYFINKYNQGTKQNELTVILNNLRYSTTVKLNF